MMVQVKGQPDFVRLVVTLEPVEAENLIRDLRIAFLYADDGETATSTALLQTRLERALAGIELVDEHRVRVEPPARTPYRLFPFYGFGA